MPSAANPICEKKNEEEKWTKKKKRYTNTQPCNILSQCWKQNHLSKYIHIKFMTSFNWYINFLSIGIHTIATYLCLMVNTTVRNSNNRIISTMNIIWHLCIFGMLYRECSMRIIHISTNDQFEASSDIEMFGILFDKRVIMKKFHLFCHSISQKRVLVCFICWVLFYQPKFVTISRKRRKRHK